MVEIKKSAVKEIENLPKRDLQAVIGKINSLAENPRQHGCEKLSGQEKYRVRCGDYRILYSIEDALLVAESPIKLQIICKVSLDLIGEQ